MLTCRETLQVGCEVFAGSIYKISVINWLQAPLQSHFHTLNTSHVHYSHGVYIRNSLVSSHSSTLTEHHKLLVSHFYSAHSTSIAPRPYTVPASFPGLTQYQHHSLALHSTSIVPWPYTVPALFPGLTQFLSLAIQNANASISYYK